MPFFKPKSGLKFFCEYHSAYDKGLSRFRAYIYDKSLKLKPKPWLSPFVKTGPGILITFAILWLILRVSNQSLIRAIIPDFIISPGLFMIKDE